MSGGVFYFHAAVGVVLRKEAVIGLHGKGDTPVHFDLLPAPEAMQLSGVRTPGTG